MSVVPQRIICDECGVVLYQGAELKSPFEIIADYDGKCVKCGRKLLPIRLRVDIRTLELKAKFS